MAELGLCGPSKHSHRPDDPSKVVIPDVSSSFSKVARIAAKFGDDKQTFQANEERQFQICLQRELFPEAAAIEEGLLKVGLRWKAIYHVMSFLTSTRRLQGSAELDLRWSAHVDLTFMPPPQTVQTKNTALEKLLEKAWQEHPDFCLRQILRLGEWRRRWNRYAFYDAAAWLWQKHPPTLIANLERIATIGSWRDLRDLLARILEGDDVSKSRDQLQVHRMAFGHRHLNAKNIPQFEAAGAQAHRATQRYSEDLLYRALFERVAELFAQQLKNDLELVKDGRQPSFCAKWCPGLDTSFDRRTLLCEGIARKVFPRSSCEEYAGLEERHYAYRIRDRLRREVLVPLKSYFNKKSSKIGKPPPGLTKSSATCQHDSTEGHDCTRFWRFLQSIKKRKMQIRFKPIEWHALGVAFQREQGASSRALAESVEGVLAVMQWAGHADRSQVNAAERGHTVIALSGNPGMEQECACSLSCREVAVATAMLMGARTGPFHNRVMVYPVKREGDIGSFYRPRSHNYYDKELMRSMVREISDTSADSQSQRHDIRCLLKESDQNLLFGSDAKLDLLALMRAALTRQLIAADEDIERISVRRVLIFSSCDIFSACRKSGSEILTDLKQCEQLFQSAGMETPEIFFWDLVGGSDFPVVANGPGIVLLSGFSLSLFDEVIATSSFTRAWNPTQRIPRSLASLAAATVIRNKEESERVLRASIGFDCRVQHSSVPMQEVSRVPQKETNVIDVCIVAPSSKMDRGRPQLWDLAPAHGRTRTRHASVCFAGPQTKVQNFDGRDISFPHETNLANSLDLALSFDWRSSLRFLVLAMDNLAETSHLASKNKCHWVRRLHRFSELRIQVVVVLCADRPATWRWSTLSEHADDCSVSFVRANGGHRGMNEIVKNTILRKIASSCSHPRPMVCSYASIRNHPRRVFITIDLNKPLYGCDEVGRVISKKTSIANELCSGLVKRVWLNIGMNDCHGAHQRGYVQVILQGRFALDRVELRQTCLSKANHIIGRIASAAKSASSKWKRLEGGDRGGDHSHQDRGADDHEDFKHGISRRRALGAHRESAHANRGGECRGGHVPPNQSEHRKHRRKDKTSKEHVHHHGPGKAWQSKHMDIAEIVEDVEGAAQLNVDELDSSD
eukprot:CAMPEP_0169070474 /NCGR_PEP_ID=MMETSP1015-20121227/5135_1 /TAXON_ID=342587 /ORGANISM="Karlodinium micrum, Strain CCMP2283" /LENGTH=1133 /DNA_ID=CAMNT_0009129475 /DNA_START=65 /DNA_END=3466 /DNA_ORIENTATION=+